MFFFLQKRINRIQIFIFTCFVSINLFGRECVDGNNILYADTLAPAQNGDLQSRAPIIYHDTVIVYNPLLSIVLDDDFIRIPDSLPISLPFEKDISLSIKISENKLFEDTYHKNELYRNRYRDILYNRTHLIKYTKADFPDKVEVLEEMPTNILQNLFKVGYDFDQDKVEKPKRFKPKRKYWLLNGDNTVKFSQNYLSQNWYKGGIGNLNLLSQQKFTLNYKKDKIQANNLFEWRLSLYTNPNDTLRNTRIGEDLIRFYSDFGIKAVNNWSYSSNIEIKTQLFENFKENSTNIVSSLLSPLNINIGILGMKFQKEKTYPKEKGKKLTFSADISPLSIQYTNVLNREVDPARFGIKDGKRHLTDFGSKIEATLKMAFNKNVNLSSRFKYFSNFEKTNIESENELKMPINRYFSTSMYLYVRFDDTKGLKKDAKLDYFQLNELLSLSFSYQW
ncbi:MAG: DUF3078 domain-containing protein [Dysgonamonadaceae bacterium]|jgi:hypothetical protein|nr:DUF3078 domain-containing protein [Dysgonamonadaceae bacterium]